MQQTPFNLRDYLMVFFRRKVIFSLLFLACIVGGVIYVIFAPRAYESSALIYIQREDILNPLLDKMAVSSQYNEQLKTISERMLSWPRQSSCKPGLPSSPVTSSLSSAASSPSSRLAAQRPSSHFRRRGKRVSPARIASSRGLSRPGGAWASASAGCSPAWARTWRNMFAGQPTTPRKRPRASSGSPPGMREVR